MKGMKKIRLALFITGFSVIASCSSTKLVPANDALYVGPKVSLKGNDLKKKKRKELKEQLTALTRPKPNSRILGIPFKLLIWNMAGNPKKKHSPAAWLKKMGEKPVLLSELDLERNVQVLQSHLENQGYFRARVTGDTIIKKKKATAHYDVATGPVYTIREVIYEKDSSRLQAAIDETQKKSLLKVGDPFDLEVVKAERIRIDAMLKEKGFYFFNPDYLLVDVDTTIGDQKLNMYINTKKQTPLEARKVYRIKDVLIYSNYSLNTTMTDTSFSKANFYRGYYVFDSAHFYKPKLFSQAMQFYPGDIYNRREHNLTLNRLINLNIFKFVKNRFEIAGDTALNAYYYLTPLPKKSLRMELGGNTKSNNITGSTVTLGFTNRNTFRGGEILGINATGGFEIQYSGAFKGYNTYRLEGEANLAIPRFITPFFSVNPRGGFVPRTNIQLGYELLNKQKLYTINSFKGQFGYIWKESLKKEHTFYPISIQYVKPVNVTQQYIDSLINNPTLKSAIDTQFILGANYNYNYNGILNKKPADGIYFNGLVDVAGNIAGALHGGKSQNEKNLLFGVPFSQYLKTEADFRFYKKVSKSNVWANRVIIGAGLPYGNSRELPFIKQFFIGGNNSLRAFRSRSVGPGTYVPDNYGTSGFVPEQAGDIKLELNTELRFKLAGPVFGALFVDAGNIWLYNDNPYKPGSKFSRDFLKELAVGTGLGVRVDINILVLRLDVAFPLRKPFLPAPDRWVIDQIKFGNSDWRRENLVWNLAIGYPF